MERIERSQHSTGVTGVHSGFHKVDQFTMGWQPGNLIILGARPSVGKTAFALNLARNAAVEFNEPVAFFSLEMTSMELLDRLIATESGISSDKLKGKLKPISKEASSYRYDDNVSLDGKSAVIDWYYHTYVKGKKTLQYVKYVNDIVLYASENEPEMAMRGLYDHGKYPYVFDPLFPIEGSPCGYGYVDLCRNPQTEIDLLKTSFVKNAMVGSMPRYFAQSDAQINEEEFLDLTQPVIHVPQVGENFLRVVEHNSLDAVYVNVLDRSIQELRETSGNTETSTGNIQSGVTAASAIAALQEASGKGSRDSTQAAYRAFSDIVDMCIELIRQFYDMPRKFRILGEYGAEQFITYTNANIKPQYQGNDFGNDMGYRLPVFDIKVSAQKKNVYTKVTQNELALQFFKIGFFNPQMTDQALMCLDLMEFDGRDSVMQKVAQQGTMFEKLVQYMQLALTFAQMVRPDMVQGISQDIMNTLGAGAGTPAAGGGVNMVQSDHIAGIGKKEPAGVAKSRERASGASQPEGGKAVKEENDK